MKKLVVIILCIWSVFTYGQMTTQSQLTKSAEFDQEIRSMIDFSVPIMSCTELSQIPKKEREQILLLDAREIEEYEVSHIPGAEHIGYKNFLENKLDQVDKDTKIIVYCSVGYRSEKIGEKIIDLGFNNVYNLYGSIFEWVNQGNQLEDTSGENTDELHTYNKKWSKWVDDNIVKKRW